MYLLASWRRNYILSQSHSHVKNQLLLSVCPCALRPLQLLYSTTGYIILSTTIFNKCFTRNLSDKIALSYIIESAIYLYIYSCLFFIESTGRSYFSFNTTYEEPSIILSLKLNLTFSIGYLLTRASSASAA